MELIWDKPGWREGAEVWLRARLSEHGLSVTGEIEQPHKRIWSTVLKIPTERGFVFFKAGSVTQHFEPALLKMLSERRPGDTLKPLAVDIERGWSLLPDAGSTMRQALQGGFGLKEWTRILSNYAKLQIAASQWTDLPSTGIPVRKLGDIPGELEGIIADESLQMVRNEEDFLNPAQLEELKIMGDEFRQMSTELASSGIPHSLEHGDLHDGNIFGSGLIYDWGDAALTFPFFTLILPIRFAASKLEIDEYADHPAQLQLRDAYLNEWGTFASREDLLKIWKTAYRLGKFARAIGWYDTVRRSEIGGEEYVGSVSGWLLEGLLHKG